LFGWGPPKPKPKPKADFFDLDKALGEADRGTADSLDLVAATGGFPPNLFQLRDCTRFVSRVWASGGVPQDDEWEDVGGWGPASRAWGVADDFVKHFEAQDFISVVPTSLKDVGDDAAPGDVLAFDYSWEDNAEWNHVQVVTGSSENGHNVTISQHSPNRDDVPWNGPGKEFSKMQDTLEGRPREDGIRVEILRVR